MTSPFDIDASNPMYAAPASAQVSTACLESFARLLHRGSELLRDGDPGQAREHLEKALGYFPDNASARHLLALSLFQIGHLERALVLYEALLLEFPENVAAKVNLAVVLLKLGRASAARPLLEDVVRATPDHRRAWGYLGVAFEQLGLITEAEGAFVAGHHSAAAKRLRERHPLSIVSPASPTEIDGTRTAIPVYRRRTLPPDVWSVGQAASAGNVGYAPLQRFAATLRPPDLSGGVPTEGPVPDRPISEPTTAAPRNEHVEEIPFEQTVSLPHALPPPSMSTAPKQNRPVVPLLDAALSSLLVVPHEATVVVHPTGLVLVGLLEGADQRDGGFVARRDVVHALAGPLRREPLAHRPPPAAEPFRDGPASFVRVAGSGQLVLAPPSGTRLLPLDMDADVAFLCQDLVVAFDHALLCDLGRMGRTSGESLDLVRFRGDGVVVLGLERPFLALDVHGEETVTLRVDSLIGWIGMLSPEPVSDPDGLSGWDELVTFSGEGTVLFRVPQDS
ncbi:MAG: tetratricopeptide repeat protein [Polyangiaceae bacterium]